jgi:hypothetical protein
MGILLVNEFTNHRLFLLPIETSDVEAHQSKLLQLLFLHSALSHFSVVSSVGYVARIQSALCSTPSFSLVFVLVRSRHLSSQCLLCYLHCRFCCLLFAPRHFLVVVGDHSVSLPSSSLSFDAFSLLVARAMHSLRFFSPPLISSVDLPTSSPRSILLLFQSESSVGVFVGMEYWEHVRHSHPRITSGVLGFWEFFGGFGA